MPDRCAFLVDVAFKLGTPTAENINWLVHTINLANLVALSYRTDVRDLTKSCNAFKNRIAFNNALASSIIFGSGKHTASRRDPSLASGLQFASTAETIHPGDALTNDHEVDVVRPAVGIDGLSG